MDFKNALVCVAEKQVDGESSGSDRFGLRYFHLDCTLGARIRANLLAKISKGIRLRKRAGERVSVCSVLLIGVIDDCGIWGDHSENSFHAIYGHRGSADWPRNRDRLRILDRIALSGPVEDAFACASDRTAF